MAMIYISPERRAVRNKRPLHDAISGLKRASRPRKWALQSASNAAKRLSRCLPVTPFAYIIRRGNSRICVRLVGRRLASEFHADHTIPPGIETGARMRLLSFAYRFLTNFAFLALVYVSLNYIEKYNNRAILAIL